MDGANTWSVRWLNALDEVERSQWDRLALPIATPLLEWQWLHHLEASGCISPDHGWQPHHLTLWDGRDLIGAAPLYNKTHSEGEFIFDHWWAKLLHGMLSAIDQFCETKHLSCFHMNFIDPTWSANWKGLNKIRSCGSKVRAAMRAINIARLVNIPK
jgi:predicted N-acyltransferase